MHYQQKGRKYSAPTTYTDLDGNSRSFNVISHDPKGTTNLFSPTETEMEDIQKQLREYRKELQDRILAEHASLCPTPLQVTFIVRGENLDSFTWKEQAVRDEGLSMDSLRDLATLVERRKELYS